VIRRAGPLGIAVAALLATLTLASSAEAAVTTWPTCPAVPLTGDSALCASGRSPQQIVAGPDGAMWFTAASAQVGRMTTTGGLSLVELPGTGTRLPQSITVGPDGALWYVDAFGPTLGRATTAFAFTSFADTGYRPEGVSTGPDGALWVVESTGNAVSRFTTTGLVTHFPLAPKTTAPNSSIAAGPDGRMWFTGRKTVGAITTAGAVSIYALPSAGSGCPSALATRAGERIWIADYCDDRVGSVTTSGAVAWYAFPGGGPGAISFGPDGNLWIGLDRTGQIVRMTPAGTVLDVVPLLYVPQFGGIAPGPDGNMWFTEITSPQVGRIDVPATRARLSPPVNTGGVAEPPSLTLVGARLRGSQLEIRTHAGEAGTLDGRAALVSVKRVRIRPGHAGFRLRPRSLGRVELSGAAGSGTLRIALSRTARRALAAARRGSKTATIEVAIRLRTTAGSRSTSRQRRVRIR
jgi:virginiamycin B lyase